MKLAELLFYAGLVLTKTIALMAVSIGVFAGVILLVDAVMKLLDRYWLGGKRFGVPERFHVFTVVVFLLAIVFFFATLSVDGCPDSWAYPCNLDGVAQSFGEALSGRLVIN